MKKSIILVLSCFFILSNCSINNSDPLPPQEVKYLWHLVKVTGGVAGVDEQFSTDTVIWSFDGDTQTLTVDNKNSDDTIEDGLDSGSYDYSVLDIDGTTYLSIDGNEFGSFETSQTTLSINQNLMSTGNGADGFIYTFQVEVITVTGD